MNLKILAGGGAGVGVIILLVSVIIGWVVVPKIIDNKVRDQTQLKDHDDDDNDTFDKWKNIPVPIKLNVYFLTVTNADEFVGSDTWDIVPQFKEVGPYSFSQTRVKYDIREGEHDTLYFRQNITYTFDPDTSGPGLYDNDTVMILNMPLFAVLTLLDVNPRLHFAAHTSLQSLLKNGETPFMNVTVKDVMFDGVELDPVYKTVEAIARLNGIALPFEIFNGYFAFYRDKNGKNADGEWRVYRGIDDSRKFNIIKSINDGKTSLEPWWVDECANINGTDGTMFPPFVEKEDRLYVYVPEICRSIYLEYSEETEFEDIPGYRFRFPDELFKGPHDYPPNECFWRPVAPPLINTTNYNGIGRIFSCKDNVPITIGKPHFLGADDSIVQDAIKSGLRPDAELHDSYLDIEPRTGFPLRAHVRLQLGGEVQPVKALSMAPFNTIPHKFYPVLWVDQAAELDKVLVDEIKDKLVKPLNIVKASKWTLVGVGIFLIVGGGGMLAFLMFRK